MCKVQISANLSNGEKIGYINYAENFTRGSAFIFDTVVLRQYWRSGIGSGLVNEAMRDMKVKGVKTVYGHVIDRKLVPFWNIHGFHEIPERTMVMFAGDIPREYNIVYECGKDIERGVNMAEDPGKLKVLMDQVGYYIQDEAKAHKEYRALAAKFREIGWSDAADGLERVADQEKEHMLRLLPLRSQLQERYDEAMR